MKILIAGSSGYIGKRLTHALLEKGHELILCIRHASEASLHLPQVSYHLIDFLSDDPLPFPTQIDAAYFLVHSMSQTGDFETREAKVAESFVKLIDLTGASQIIYLSGLLPKGEMSSHIRSRYHVEQILYTAKAALTTLRAGIVIGSGSASFEIIRDLVEKLPLMIAPKWTDNLCQPISVSDVLFYLTSVLGDQRAYNYSFDIGGPQVLSYKKMMLEFARVRGLKRHILSVPFFTPRLSSYWLYFITSTSYSLAKALVESLKADAICFEHRIETLYPHDKILYEEAIKRAFAKFEQNEVVSSWKDALILPGFTEGMKVPTFGCLIDFQQREIPKEHVEACYTRFISIGGANGWYGFDRLWQFRGFIDRLFGGVGLRRGRNNPQKLQVGEALDFWRVLLIDPASHHLVLWAEMKLPGEAWLEFRILQKGEKTYLTQKATFRPVGVWGRVYWYLMLPFHFFIFRSMIEKIRGKS